MGAADRASAHRAPLLVELCLAGLAEDVVVAGRQHHVGRPDAADDAELRVRERGPLSHVSEQRLINVLLGAAAVGWGLALLGLLGLLQKPFKEPLLHAQLEDHLLDLLLLGNLNHLSCSLDLFQGDSATEEALDKHADGFCSLALQVLAEVLKHAN